MASVMLSAVALGRRFSLAAMFFIALSGILISDPLAVHQQGFWLSFTAVAGLLWFFQVRANHRGHDPGPNRGQAIARKRDVASGK